MAPLYFPKLFRIIDKLALKRKWHSSIFAEFGSIFLKLQAAKQSGRVLLACPSSSSWRLACKCRTAKIRDRRNHQGGGGKNASMPHGWISRKWRGRASGTLAHVAVRISIIRSRSRRTLGTPMPFMAFPTAVMSTESKAHFRSTNDGSRTLLLKFSIGFFGVSGIKWQ